MSRTMELQPLLSLQGAAAVTSLTQDISDWIDSSKYNVGVIQAQVLKSTNCTVIVEGCDVIDGTFVTHTSLATSSENTWTYLLKNAPQGVSNHLYNLLRWRITASAAWETTFRLTLVLK